MNTALVKYAFMAALRDKLVVSMIVVFVLGACLSLFFGSSAVIEKDQFTVIFTASSLRILSVFGLVLFVVFFIRRSFDGKDIEFLLSRPVSRPVLIFSYFIAFCVLSFVMSVAVGLCVYTVSPHLFSQAHIFWVFSIFIESVIMVSIALFFAMYFSSAANASMAALAFYALARMMGQLIGIVDSPLVDSGGGLSMALQLVSVLVPRLDLMGQSSWLIYGVSDSAFGFVHMIAQGVVFSSLVLGAACFDLCRRAF